LAEYFPDATGMFWTDAAYIRRGFGTKEDPAIQLRLRLRTFSFSDTYITPELENPPPGAMAFDTETHDPTLMTKGAGWAFNEGEIIGLSVAWYREDGSRYSAYFALRHVAGNVVYGPEPVIRWLKDQVKRTDLIWVMAHANYDVGWIFHETGEFPAGRIVDVQHMAALLDEYRFSYSLNSISEDWLGHGKITNRLTQLENDFGCKHSTMMGCLKSLPGPVVASYAVGDAEATLDCYFAMLPKIIHQGLDVVYELESDIIPMSVDMRRLGIRVNVEAAERLSEDIKTKRMPALVDEIKRLTGVLVSPWQAESCEAALKHVGVNDIMRTANDSPQINSELLNRVAKYEPVGQHILDLRKMSKISGTFIDGHILYYQHNGRLHPSFNQLRSESDTEGGVGTVTGRYAASDPALQQIPVRDPEWGPEIRSLFLPEDGEEFASIDYSAQEPRMAIHFAHKIGIRGSQAAVDAFRSNPRTDPHKMVAEFSGLPRDKAKTLNLGLAYGMKQAKMARALGLPTQWMQIDGRQWTKITPSEVEERRRYGYQCVEVAGEEAKEILYKWKTGAPFLVGLFEECEAIAINRGFICTLLRRRCRFGGQADKRIDTYKAMNRLCQSSSADQTKKAMSILRKEKIPIRLTLHDELLMSIQDRNIAKRTAEIMEHAVELVIPSATDMKFGQTWGHISKV
jgi:DNA polymerase I-like protein with 3'-5' exonuclease and polymerase domains